MNFGLAIYGFFFVILTRKCFDAWGIACSIANLGTGVVLAIAIAAY